ncbi:excinuclease ABC subunit UvrC [Thermincola ferriacetica]
MDIQDKLRLLPDKPGVYLMKNADGDIIYVGKAVSLKNRVRSYFQSSRAHSPKVRSMVAQVEDFEYILTDSEIEALILECNLIKKHRPRYNVRLKDDKSYPYLKLTVDEEFPRLFMTRRVVRDGARYYGPYTNAGAVHETLRVLKQVFPLRSCKKKNVDRNARPCLNYHIKKCLGPCNNQISVKDYRDMVNEIVLFLEGRQEELIKQIEAKMTKAAEQMEFERAALYRDQAKALRAIVEKQKVVVADLTDQDFIGLAREGEDCCASVFFVRSGKLLGREHYILEGVGDDPPAEILGDFIKQYYLQVEYVPKEILCSVRPAEISLIEKWLTERRGNKVQVKVPQRGDKAKLVELVEKNAREELARHRLEMEKSRARTEDALLGLEEYLDLPRVPRRIECYDISNTQGRESVGSMVVFQDGEPKNSEYRRFKIKTVEGTNDFASMQEVIGRRFGKAREEFEAIEEGMLEPAKAKFAKIPDLVIIDGGKGQLNAAREVMINLGYGFIPTFGLAKEEELLFAEDRTDPIVLPRNSESLYLLQRIRDEAHRFAITYHRHLRGKHSLKSILDDIPGIGVKRRKAIIQHFRSFEKLLKASAAEIAEVEGISEALAEQVWEYLHHHDK